MVCSVHCSTYNDSDGSVRNPRREERRHWFLGGGRYTPRLQTLPRCSCARVCKAGTHAGGSRMGGQRLSGRRGRPSAARAAAECGGDLRGVRRDWMAAELPSATRTRANAVRVQDIISPSRSLDVWILGTGGEAMRNLSSGLKPEWDLWGVASRGSQIPRSASGLTEWTSS